MDAQCTMPEILDLFTRVPHEGSGQLYLEALDGHLVVDVRMKPVCTKYEESVDLMNLKRRANHQKAACAELYKLPRRYSVPGVGGDPYDPEYLGRASSFIRDLWRISNVDYGPGSPRITHLVMGVWMHHDYVDAMRRLEKVGLRRHPVLKSVSKYRLGRADILASPEADRHDPCAIIAVDSRCAVHIHCPGRMRTYDGPHGKVPVAVDSCMLALLSRDNICSSSLPYDVDPGFKIEVRDEHEQ